MGTSTTGFPMDTIRWDLDFGFLIIRFSKRIDHQPLTFLQFLSLSGKLVGGRICVSKMPSPVANRAENLQAVAVQQQKALVGAELTLWFLSFTEANSRATTCVSSANANYGSLRAATASRRSSLGTLVTIYCFGERHFYL